MSLLTLGTLYIWQALSINRSLSKAKAAAGMGQMNSRDLINTVIESVQEAGGKIDYAEVWHLVLC